MSRQKTEKQKSHGKCSFCGDTFSKIAEGSDRPEYWMHLDVQADAKLKDLDNFLRKI